MQLQEINIKNFGKFTDRSFVLESGINAFFGLNEAGKSTIVAFINQILFGFAKKGARSQENYQIEKNPVVFGGSLVYSHGNSKWVVERFQEKNAQSGIVRVFKDELEVPENLFFNHIHQIDQQFYSETFLFDANTLLKIFTLSQEEITAQINHLGASNSQEMMRLVKKFAKQADDIYLPRGKRELNQQLSRLNELAAKREGVSNQAERYLTLTAEVLPLKKQLTSEKEKYQEIGKEIRQTQQLIDRKSNFTEYTQLKAKQEPVQFDENAYNKLQDLVRKTETLERQKEQLVAQTKGLDASISPVSTPMQTVADEYDHFLMVHKQLENEQSQIITEQNSLEQLYAYQSELKALTRLKANQISELRDDYAVITAKNAEVEQLNDRYLALLAQNQQNTLDYHLKPESENLLSKKSMFVTAIISSIAVLTVLLVTRALLPTIVSLLVVVMVFIGIRTFFRSNNGHETPKTGLPVKTPTELQELQQEIDAAKTVLSDAKNSFYAHYGFNVPADLNAMLIQASTLSDKEIHLNQLKLSIQKSREDADSFLDNLSAAIAPSEIDIEDFSAVTSAVKSIQKKITENDQNQNKLNAQMNLIAELEHQNSLIKDEMSSLLEVNGEDSLASFTKAADAARYQTQLKDKIQHIRNTLGSDTDLVELNRVSADQLNLRLAELHASENQINSVIMDLQQKIADIESRAELLGTDQQARLLEQEVADSEDVIKEDVVDWLQNKLVAKLLDTVLNLASKNRFPKMAAASKKYFELLSGGQYDDVSIADKITVRSTTDKKVKQVNQLSRGTSEQLYFALKLAFVEQISDEINLPLVIDDAFVNFDLKRVQYMQQLFAELKNNHQILIFTAREDLLENIVVDNKIII